MHIIFAALTLIGVAFNIFTALIAGMALASIYAMVLAPGIFFGGRELSREKLVAELENYWSEPEAIADFIKDNWYSIKYVSSSPKRGGACSLISMASFGLAGWLWYSDAETWVTLWSLANGIVLFPIGNKANMASFIVLQSPNHPRWDLACVSMIATSQLFGGQTQARIVERYADSEKIKSALRRYSTRI